MHIAENDNWIELRGEAPVALDRNNLEHAFGRAPWLVVVPHDDDLVLGSGLLLTLAARAGIEIHVVVCTDGALGYTQPADRLRLPAIRREELATAMQRLDLDPGRLTFLDFPDGALLNHLGARPPEDNPGLGQALTRCMRAIRPGAVFACHEKDVHPDHRAVAWDAAIACFWASSEIWLDLGVPIALPQHVHYGVYAAFAGNPDVRVLGDAAAQARKLAALAAFESQPVIDALVAQARQDGAVEFFQLAARPPHRTASYATHFGPPPVT